MDIRGTHVLVVDDHPLNAKLTRLVLTQAGCIVETAGDAEQALDVLERFSPRVILMDLQLPGIDGFALTQRLKSDAAMRHTVIIALTAYAMKGDEQRAIEAGCDGYIAKPIETKHLVSQIEQYLAREKDPR